LCLAQGRVDRATAVFRLVESPADPALAVRLGDGARGERAAAARRREDAGDLFANTTLAVLGLLAADTSSAGLSPADQTQRQQMLETAALLAEPQLAQLALPTAQGLATALPRVPFVRLLQARALLQCGHAAQASAVHAELLADGVALPTLWREITAATAVAAY